MDDPNAFGQRMKQFAQASGGEYDGFRRPVAAQREPVRSGEERSTPAA